VAETIHQLLTGAMGGLAFLVGKYVVDRLAESHKAAVGIAAKRRERFQDKQAEVAAEIYEKLASSTEAVFTLIVLDEPESRISRLLKSETRTKRLRDLLPNAEQAWGELSAYHNRHGLYFPEPLLSRTKQAGYHMEKVIDDVHKMLDQGLDQIEPKDKIILDKARLEAVELLVEIRTMFYTLMLGNEGSSHRS
jgi:hypothetical protein